MSSQYGNDSIVQLKGADRVRTRPASMLGSSGLAGARHSFTEIYGNALDEHSAGYGTRLDIVYYEDGSISVRDYGRGVPLGWNNKEHNWNWHTIYNELYAGGKYDNGQWYLQSLGKVGVFSKSDKRSMASIEANVCRIADVPMDNKFHTYGDIDIKNTADTVELKVNNKDWSVVTWDYLCQRLNYLASVGLNGLGAASAQYTSEHFTVKSYHDGVVTSRSFSHGIPLVNGKEFNMTPSAPLTQEQIKAIPEEKEATSEPNGTFVYWKPDIQVFSDVNIGGDWLLATCKDIANVAGMELHFTDKQKSCEEIVYHAGSLKDELEGSDNIFTANAFSHGQIQVSEKPFVYLCNCNIALAPSRGNIATTDCFHNSVRMHNGVQFDGVHQAIEDFLKVKASVRGIKLLPGDYISSFDVVVSTESNYASFRNQTKDGVDDGFILNIVHDTVLDLLNTEYAKGNEAIKGVVNAIFENASVREALKVQETLIKETKKIDRQKEPDKFVSCDAYENKEYDKAELWIVEGDSAKGGVKKARDKTFQAIYPIRGKGLNVAKVGLDRILKNKEIREIFSLLGTGFDLNDSKTSNFDMSKLKFNKIIFGTDADEDGYQIRVLLFLTFYKLAPRLITEGHVFIGETPRFKIDLSNGTVLYARNDAERDKILKSHKTVKKVSRFKGLGEVNADVLAETTINPATRNLIPLNCDFQNKTECDFIDALFGADKLHKRKEIITQILGEEVANMLEDNALLIQSIDEDEDIDTGTEEETVRI